MIIKNKKWRIFSEIKTSWARFPTWSTNRGIGLAQQLEVSAHVLQQQSLSLTWSSLSWQPSWKVEITIWALSRSFSHLKTQRSTTSAPVKSYLLLKYTVKLTNLWERTLNSTTRTTGRWALYRSHLMAKNQHIHTLMSFNVTSILRSICMI